MTIKHNSTTHSALTALLLLAALALTGCGIKGPLVHSAQAPAPATSSAVPASAASI